MSDEDPADEGKPPAESPTHIAHRLGLKVAGVGGANIVTYEMLLDPAVALYWWKRAGQ